MRVMTPPSGATLEKQPPAGYVISDDASNGSMPSRIEDHGFRHDPASLIVWASSASREGSSCLDQLIDDLRAARN